MSTTEISSRAYYKRTRAAWRRTLRVPFLLGSLAIVALTALVGVAVPAHKELVIGWCSGFGFGMLWALWDSPPAFIENWGIGAEGEERTAATLSPFGAAGWTVLHDLEDEYGNLDHVIVGPAGVFLLDTKAWSGQISLEDGLIVIRRQLSRRNDRRDARLGRRMRGAAYSLRRRLRDTTKLDHRVTAVVVIWGEFSQGLVEDDQVVYISGHRLARWLEERPALIDRREQNLLGLALKSGLAVSRLQVSSD